LLEGEGPAPGRAGGLMADWGHAERDGVTASAARVQQRSRLSDRQRGSQYTSTRNRVPQFAIFHSNVCLAQPFESNYRWAAGRPSRGADVTTTADRATITAQDRPHGRPEPVHVLDGAATPEA